MASVVFVQVVSTKDQILSLKQIYKKLKYLGVAFTSAGRQIEEFDT